MSQHTFSIESKINPVTNQPFGPKYGGNFNIRRPSILDEAMIENRMAAERNSFGIVNPEQIPDVHDRISRVFCTIHQLATETLPAWFNRSSLFLDDETDMKAIGAVNQEVSGFLTSFRSIKDSGSGGEGS
jgi:hypothetical protein